MSSTWKIRNYDAREQMELLARLRYHWTKREKHIGTWEWTQRFKEVMLSLTLRPLIWLLIQQASWMWMADRWIQEDQQSTEVPHTSRKVAAVAHPIWPTHTENITWCPVLGILMICKTTSSSVVLVKATHSIQPQPVVVSSIWILIQYIWTELATRSKPMASLQQNWQKM